MFTGVKSLKDLEGGAHLISGIDAQNLPRTETINSLAIFSHRTAWSSDPFHHTK